MVAIKKPVNNPLGSARAGAGVVKCGVNVDANGTSEMKHTYNISLPVVTDRSIKNFQHLNIGANEHSNIVAEWTALAYSIINIIWTAERPPKKYWTLRYAKTVMRCWM